MADFDDSKKYQEQEEVFVSEHLKQRPKNADIDF